MRERLDAIVGQLRAYVPVMAPYFDVRRSLRDYSAALRPPPAAPEHAARQRLLAGAVSRVLGRSLGPVEVTAADVAAVNIVDHHQLLNHPLLLGTNVLAAADRLGAGHGRPIVTLACSNVPPSNEYQRGGFGFAGQQVPYFGSREQRDSVYYAAPRRFDFVRRLHATRRWAGFGPAEQDFLERYEALLEGLDYGRCRWHRDQVAVAVRATWPLLFDAGSRAALPQLLYANSEEVTRELLLELLPGEDLMSAALFDPRIRADVLDTFRGTVAAWDEAAGTGTHFFWRRRPGTARLLRLYVDGDALVPADPRFRALRVPLEPEAVREHLLAEEIVPAVSMQASMYVFTGMRPLVGAGSLVYLSRFRDGWRDVLARHGRPREAELAAAVDISGLVAGTPLFFRRDAAGTLRTSYAADVLAAGGVGPDYLDRMLSTSFADAFSVAASGIYDLFRGSYIPPEVQLSRGVSLDEAAAVAHPWL